MISLDRVYLPCYSCLRIPMLSRVVTLQVGRRLYFAWDKTIVASGVIIAYFVSDVAEWLREV